MKDDKKILQQKLVEYQFLQQHLESLQQQAQLLNQQNIELLKLKDNLSFIENSKSDNEIFSQIGPGIFSKATLKNNKEVLFNIGSDVLVNKRIPEAVSLLENQHKEISNSINEIEEQFKKIVARVIELQEDIERLKE